MGEHENPEQGTEGGAGGGEHEGITPAGVIGKGGSWLARAGHLLEGVGHYAKPVEEVVEHLPGGLGKAIPYVGAAASGASALAEGYEAQKEFRQEGIHSDKAWEHVGGSALGAAGVAVNFLPPPYNAIAGGALAAGEIGLDGLGKLAGKVLGEKSGFNADQVVGGLIRGQVGDKSLGYKMGGAVDNALGGGTLGHVAGAGVGAVTNALGMPLNLANTVAGGLTNWVGNAIDGKKEKTDYYGQAQHAVGNAVGNGVGALGALEGRAVAGAGNLLNRGISGAGSLVSGAGQLVNAGAGAVGGALDRGAGAVGGLVNAGAGAVGTGISNGAHALGGMVGGGLGRGIDTVGGWLGAGTSAVGHGVSNVIAGEGHLLNQGISAVGSGVGAVGNAIGNGASAIGGGLARGASAIGGGIASGASKVGGFLKSIF